jgi:glycyl-tRNA synthetase beta chain
MNKELLIEIFSEEIPARMQLQAQKDAAHIFTKLLSEQGAVFKDVTTYVAPRRLVICVTGLEGITEKQTEIRRGPKTTAPDGALHGFLKSTGLNFAQLIEKDGYWMAHIEHPGQAIEASIHKVFHELLVTLPWP